MTHVTEEQLVLYFYGESGETAKIADHLASCQACRADLAGIQRTLNVVEGLAIPERGPAYGEQVWQKLSPRIKKRSRFWALWLQPRQLAFAGAVAALVIVAITAGRGTVPAPGKVEVATLNEAARNRVMLVNMSDHLERSKTVLIELANSEPGSLGQDRLRAEDLLAANRLYRISAQRESQTMLAELLDELEPLLMQVSNAQPGDLSQIQRRLSQQDLLFKIRVVDAQMRQAQRRPVEISSN